MSDNAKVLEKVAKLLALGESPNEEEAASAVEKAQALLLKNGLTMEEVEAVRRPGQLVGEATDHAIIEQWENALGGGIARALGGECVVRGLMHPSERLWLGTLVFYGPGSTPKGMRRIYEFVRERIGTTATLESAGPPDFLTEILAEMEGRDPQEGMLAGVRLGMVERVVERLIEQADRVTASESFTGTSLVVSREAIQRKLREQNPDLEQGAKLNTGLAEQLGRARGRALAEEIPLNTEIGGA